MINHEKGAYQELIAQLMSDGSIFTLLYLKYSYQRFDFIPDSRSKQTHDQLVLRLKQSLRETLINLLDGSMISAITEAYPDEAGAYHHLFLNRLILADAMYAAILAT